MAGDNYNYYKFKGKIVEMPEAKTGVSVNGEWKVQSFIVEDEETQKKYPFEVYGKDKCDSLDLHVGDAGVFFFNIHSNMYNGKYYVSLRVWRVNKNHDGKGQPYRGTQDNTVKNNVPENATDITDVDQLPF